MTGGMLKYRMESQSNNNENKGFFSNLWERWTFEQTHKVQSENIQPKMEAEKVETRESPYEVDSCRKKKTADGEFLANVKDHIEEFVNTPLDQHRICLKKTIQGLGDKLKKSGSMFGSSKTENELDAKEVDGSPEVQSTSAQ